MPNPLTDYIVDKIFTVTEYLTLVNELLTPLKVSVEGEISDLKILPQWVFFSLKDSDDNSLLRCGLHAGAFRRMGVPIEDGMKVKVLGYGKISDNTGNFGFWVSSIEPLGEGALRRAYQLLVEKLEKEGLFSRKRELPKFISHIGVISSRNGVVIQDLLKNLEKRGISLDFLHSGVEGASSAEELEKAIQFFNTKKEKPDVLVVIRGGGSLESLQGFNNESVVRALFASPVPVLVGIGHDVDVPIATLVADWSASTPTAVAHVINSSWAPLTELMPRLQSRIAQRFSIRLKDVEHAIEVRMISIREPISRMFSKFGLYESSLTAARKSIRDKIVASHERLNRLKVSLRERMEQGMVKTKRSVIEYERLLRASDPASVLERGYSIVYGSSGALLRSSEQVSLGETVNVRLEDGILETKVIGKNTSIHTSIHTSI